MAMMELCEWYENGPKTQHAVTPLGAAGFMTFHRSDGTSELIIKSVVSVRRNWRVKEVLGTLRSQV